MSRRGIVIHYAVVAAILAGMAAWGHIEVSRATEQLLRQHDEEAVAHWKPLVQSVTRRFGVFDLHIDSTAEPKTMQELLSPLFQWVGECYADKGKRRKPLNDKE